MTTLLTILSCAIFLGGAYLMGNYFLDGFDEDFSQKVMNIAFGLLCWTVIAIFVAICYLIYLGINILIK